MKRGTIHGLEEHVAHEVIAYLHTQESIEHQKTKHSVQALEKLFLKKEKLREHKWMYQCVSCLVWFKDDWERDKCASLPCEDPKCEEKCPTTCGRFGCLPVRCFSCNMPLCLQDCGEGCSGMQFKCSARACSTCSEKIPKCQGCLLGHEDHITCPLHRPELRAYIWKPGVEITACTKCITYWDRWFPNIDDRSEFVEQ